MERSLGITKSKFAHRRTTLVRELYLTEAKLEHTFLLRTERYADNLNGPPREDTLARGHTVHSSRAPVGMPCQQLLRVFSHTKAFSCIQKKKLGNVDQ
jgi:hypothetical protein